MHNPSSFISPIHLGRVAAAAVISWRTHLSHRLGEAERGEGVISAAIAVLIMAFLGAAMWLAFKGIFQNASDKTSANVEQIGN